MYIIKNALRCIARSKGRNVLIGIIALVIAISACIGLSIRQAAESAKKNALDGMSVTGTIEYDRADAIGNISGGRPGFGGGSGGFDFNFEDLSAIMGSGSSLTLEEYQKYASASSVKGFYYTITAYINGSEGFSPLTDETEDSEDSDENEGDFDISGIPGFSGGMDFMKGASGDFSLIGYSSDASMTAFVNGTASIVDGEMFGEGTSELACVISEELAMVNNIAVGDTIIITNPENEDEAYTLTVSGIYSSTENNDFSMSRFGTSQDPANHIYMSAVALQSIIDESAEASDSAIEGTLEATYLFADTDAYYKFEDEVRDLGLSESYVVQSPDIQAFENSLTPLKTLSKIAGWFLVVILIIGAIILVVLNIFSVRERKYEVGVLTAMGMKKWKVAVQFMCEILVVTMIAFVIGAGIGAVSSVPVTNALLEVQAENQSSQQNQMNEGFGRPGNMGGGFGGNFGGGDMPSNMPSNMPNGIFGGMNNPFGDKLSGATNYITEIDSAMNLTVVIQMIGVGLLLTLIASLASVLFIMRYDPLKILANRD